MNLSQLLPRTQNNRYLLTIAIAKRARQINHLEHREDTDYTDATPPMVQIESPNPLTIAAAEIREEKLLIKTRKTREFEEVGHYDDNGAFVELNQLDSNENTNEDANMAGIDVSDLEETN